MMKKIVITILFALSALLLMSGCSSDSTSTSSALDGTAATGAPIDGTVTVKDALGVEIDIATAVDGSFKLDVAGMTPPYLIKVMPSSGPVLYSFASQNGQTVNLTPTTNLTMFLAYGKGDLDEMYLNWDGTAVTAAEVATQEGVVRANLVTEIEAAGLDAASFDLFTTPFLADGTGIDGVMDNLTISVDMGAGTYVFADGSGDPLPFDEAAVPPAAPAPDGAISLVTVTDGVHVLNGAYSTGCYGNGGGSTKEDLDISADTWSYTNTGYTSGNCSTGASVSTITGTLSAGADLAIEDWVDGMGDSEPVVPDAADGATVITRTEPFTPLMLTITGATGDFSGIPSGTESPLFYVVDDTVAKAILYRDYDYENGVLYAGTADPYTQQ